MYFSVAAIISFVACTVNALSGVQVYAGISCGFVDCANNLTSGTITLGGCYSSCHPCIPGTCQYQYFQPLGVGGFQQFLCGNDATCNIPTCEAYLNYSCGTCVPLSGFAVKVTCPIERAVGGTSDCGGTTCRNISAVSASLNKCYQFCDPCTSVCQYVTFQAYGTTVMSYGYGTDSKCLPANSNFLTNYSCGVCTVIQGHSVNIPCPQTTNANIAASISDAVIASAAATIINADPTIPTGVTVNAPTGASVGVDGLFTVTVPVTASTGLSGTQTQALRDAIAASIAQQFNILPVSRVTVVLSKKRGEDVVNSATVKILDAAAGSIQLPLLLICNLLVFSFFM